MTEVNKEPRVADSMKELELLMEISVKYKDLYYKQRPFMNFLLKLGYQHKAVAQHCTNRAMRELTQVNYDHALWTVRYSEGLLNY